MTVILVSMHLFVIYNCKYCVVLLPVMLQKHYLTAFGIWHSVFDKSCFIFFYLQLCTRLQLYTCKFYTLLPCINNWLLPNRPWKHIKFFTYGKNCYFLHRKCTI